MRYSCVLCISRTRTRVTAALELRRLWKESRQRLSLLQFNKQKFNTSSAVIKTVRCICMHICEYPLPQLRSTAVPDIIRYVGPSSSSPDRWHRLQACARSEHAPGPPVHQAAQGGFTPSQILTRVRHRDNIRCRTRRTVVYTLLDWQNLLSHVTSLSEKRTLGKELLAWSKAVKTIVSLIRRAADQICS